MPSVCFYFQVHQPFRLRPYSFLDIAQKHDYFDDDKNRAIFKKVAEKCYLPANRQILKLIERTKGAFRCSYSITGVAIEQMELYAPEVLESFIELSKTDCVEFLGETYYHSLSALYDPEDFREQVELHGRLMKRLFGKKPKVFRNTELVYTDEIGRKAAALGFAAVLAEGADDILDWRSPNYVYKAQGSDALLLLKNYRLSDDVAFRFSNRGWIEYPLMADKFAGWVHQVSGGGETVNLFMDYETFGEHQWKDTGIFEFLSNLPSQILKRPDWSFLTPSETIKRYKPVAEMPFPRTVSWADIGRDLTAWNGNHMQRHALKAVYEMGPAIRKKGDKALLDVWRKLQTSDHFYYMCTKWSADGDVHAYFSPYGSPYDAYINYMNVLADLTKEDAAPRKNSGAKGAGGESQEDSAWLREIVLS